MNIFESLTRFLQGSALVVALSFLLVGYYPALANDNTVNGVIPDPTNPPPEGVDPLPPGYEVGAGEVEFGECDQNYLEDLPNWLQDLINAYLKGRTHSDLEAYHPDVYKKYWYYQSDGVNPDWEAYRGFHADGNSKALWTYKLSMWFVFRKVIYVNGVIKEIPRNDCDWVISGPLSLNGVAHHSLQRIDDRFNNSYWSRYHLFTRNCQDWAEWVLYGRLN